jgi:phenylacetate-CoA ligase
MSDPTDAERYPTLSEAGRRMLQRLREHRHAPIYRNQSGNRLTHDDLQRVRTFEQQVASATFGEQREQAMPWLPEHLALCYREVPYYREMGGSPRQLRDVPTISRADLARDIARFVPDSAPLDRLINFQTSGTTGHPLLIASHPVVAASYLALHRRALARVGVELRAGSGDVGLVLIGFQQKCFTYVSVTPSLNEAGLCKINLYPNDWREPDDRRRYLEDLAPEVLAGDPISFVELLALEPRLRPRALLSTSMTLLPGLRRELETSFDCPVVDLYSLNEAGPVAAFDEASGGHVLLQYCMLVEILDATGNSVPRGQRGEITLTGGFNFCLPLLRYRTGDFAALELRGNEPVLIGLEGRAPIRFLTSGGAWLNNLDVTHALNPFGLRQFQLHQARDGSLLLRVRGAEGREAALRQALAALFGPEQTLTVSELGSSEGKLAQYTSELFRP